MMLTRMCQKPLPCVGRGMCRVFWTISNNPPKTFSRTLQLQVCIRSSAQIARNFARDLLRQSKCFRHSHLFVSAGLFGYLRNVPASVLERPNTNLNPPNRNVVFLKPKPGVLRSILSTFLLLFRAFRRYIRFLLTFSPFLLFYPLMYCGIQARHFYLRCLLVAVEYSGPTLMKLAQWASTRRDLFSPDFCDTFSQLQRKVKAHSWYFTKHRLKRAFGKNWRKILVKFDNNREPIGSGCIAQVSSIKGFS